eukprot:5582912-Heterocapsa_arctica.AAC.1
MPISPECRATGGNCQAAPPAVPCDDAGGTDGDPAAGAAGRSRMVALGGGGGGGGGVPACGEDATAPALPSPLPRPLR